MNLWDNTWITRSSKSLLLFMLKCSEDGKNKEERLEIRDFLVLIVVWMMWNSPDIFLFIPLVADLSSLGQKTVKFASFWVEFCEFRLVLAFPPSLVTNNFYCVEIHGFHIQVFLVLVVVRMMRNSHDIFLFVPFVVDLSSLGQKTVKFAFFLGRILWISFDSGLSSFFGHE